MALICEVCNIGCVDAVCEAYLIQQCVRLTLSSIEYSRYSSSQQPPPPCSCCLHPICLEIAPDS